MSDIFCPKCETVSYGQFSRLPPEKCRDFHELQEHSGFVKRCPECDMKYEAVRAVARLSA